MRIIAGTAKGVRIEAPRGRDTRPPLDRVKEALFSLLGERVMGARALDVYSGSGSFGLEALSRGAAHCTFVDSRRIAIRIAKENAEKCDLAERCVFTQMPALKALRQMLDGLVESPEHPAYDVVFFDPPFADVASPGGRTRLAEELGLAAEMSSGQEGLVVLRVEADSVRIPLPSGLIVSEERTYGRSTLHFLSKRDG